MITYKLSSLLVRVVSENGEHNNYQPKQAQEDGATCHAYYEGHRAGDGHSCHGF